MGTLSHFPRTRKHEIFNNNVYFLNNTSMFNNLIKELFDVATFRHHTALQTLRQRLDGGPQEVDVEFAPCLVWVFFRDSKL